MSQKRIKTPCHEPFDAMSPVEGGRHCESCEKTVHDLTGYSLKDAACFFERVQGKVCVRARARQDGTLVFAVDPKRRLPVYVAFGTAVALASGAAITTAAADDVPSASELQEHDVFQGEYVEEPAPPRPVPPPDAGAPDAGVRDAGPPVRSP